jgi:hypothetical protein
LAYGSFIAPEVQIFDEDGERASLVDFWSIVKSTSIPFKQRLESGRFVITFPLQTLYGDDYLDGPYRFIKGDFS